MSVVPRIFAIAVAVCVAVSCAGPDKIVAESNRAYFGYITTGKKFGVAIGQSAVGARAVLRGVRRFEYKGTYDCIDLRRIVECERGQKYDVYVSGASIRNGLPISYGIVRVEIGAEDDVVAIVWRFYLLPSIDL